MPEKLSLSPFHFYFGGVERPFMRRHLEPYLRRFDRNGDALVALHLRTKYVDEVGGVVREKNPRVEGTRLGG